MSPLPPVPIPVTTSPFVSEVVASSDLIETLAQARAYYLAHLARSHEITRYDRRVDIVFEATATHLFSSDEDEDPSAIPAADRVERRLGPGRVEVRRFNVERARLMDDVLPALSRFTVSEAGQAGKRLVYGPPLPDGRYMRVVLRPGPAAAMTCVSAYPVPAWAWKNARNSRAAKFPP